MEQGAVSVVARALKCTTGTAKALLEHLEYRGWRLVHRPVADDLCPACGVYRQLEESGLCFKCTTERELERQKEADYAEEARLAKMTERRVNQVKKARERMRRRHLANPRDTEARQMLAVVDAFIALMEAATDEEWEDANADMEAAIF